MKFNDFMKKVGDPKTADDFKILIQMDSNYFHSVETTEAIAKQLIEWASKEMDAYADIPWRAKRLGGEVKEWRYYKIRADRDLSITFFNNKWTVSYGLQAIRAIMRRR